MKALALLLFVGVSHAQTICTALVVQGVGTYSINLSGCTVSSIPPPVIPPPAIPPPVIPPPVIVGDDVTVDGYRLPAVTRRPYSTAVGGGARIGAFSMPAARCSGPALSRSWQHNIDLAEYRGRTAVELFALRGDEALSFKLTIPTFDASGGFTYLDNIGSGGILAPVFMSVTATPCDFNAAKTVPYGQPGHDSCYQMASSGLGFAWANITGPLPISYCRLTKGQTYYMNIRFQDGNESSCPGLCGGSLAFN